MLNITLVGLTVAVMAMATPAMTKPLLLTDVQMDGITAGNLVLPNGNTVFEGFDNSAPGEFHPSFDRSATAALSTAGIPPSGDPADGFGGNNEGPWSAHFVSPVIGCSEAPCL